MCCRTLQTLYSDAGYPEEATRYNELAERYEERSSTHELAAVAHEAATPGAVSEVHRQTESEAYEQSEAAPEFSIDEAAEISIADESAAAAKAEPTSSPWPTVSADAHKPNIEAAELPVVAETPQHFAEAAASTQEIDLSSEWDDATTVEADEPGFARSGVETPAEAAVASHKGEEPAEIEVHDPVRVDETVEEIRFYLANGMPEQSMAALAKLQVLTNDQAKIDPTATKRA
jgi:hypothetical protein